VLTRRETAQETRPGGGKKERKKHLRKEGGKVPKSWGAPKVEHSLHSRRKPSSKSDGKKSGEGPTKIQLRDTKEGATRDSGLASQRGTRSSHGKKKGGDEKKKKKKEPNWKGDTKDEK